MLLQILEDGSLTDAKGRKIDFTNTIIIMTSNVGADKLQKEASFGFRAERNADYKDLNVLHDLNRVKVQDELKKLLRPELLNRIDKTIVFRALTRKDVTKILDLQLEELRERLSKHGIGLELSKTAKQYLLDKGYDPLNGARPMRRMIQDTLEDQIALDLLSNRYSKGDVVQVATKNKALVYTPSVEVHA
jgi:ATP-dependent Clp protease ATP-binding subunit ClpC